MALSAQEGLLGGSASDEAIHPSNYRERPAEVAAPDGGERSVRAAREARLVPYGLAQEGPGELYLVLYVHARKGEIEGAVGGNKVPLGLGGGRRPPGVMIAASSSSAKRVSSARSSMSLRIDFLRKIPHQDGPEAGRRPVARWW